MYQVISYMILLEENNLKKLKNSKISSSFFRITFQRASPDSQFSQGLFKNFPKECLQELLAVLLE